MKKTFSFEIWRLRFIGTISSELWYHYTSNEEMRTSFIEVSISKKPKLPHVLRITLAWFQLMIGYLK